MPRRVENPIGPGGAARPDLNPPRIVFTAAEIHGSQAFNPRTRIGSQFQIYLNTRFRTPNVAITFQVPTKDVPKFDAPRYIPQQDAPQFVNISRLIDRASLSAALAGGMPIERFFELTKGYPSGSISRISEISIRDAL